MNGKEIFSITQEWELLGIKISIIRKIKHWLNQKPMELKFIFSKYLTPGKYTYQGIVELAGKSPKKACKKIKMAMNEKW